ncbi:MAG: hypothetical protein OSJ28_11450 [Desulfovibrio sp.]|nr:hypothetical protein [Desulfovibrio sp.]
MSFAKTTQLRSYDGKERISQNAEADLWPLQGLVAPAQSLAYRYFLALAASFEARHEIRQFKGRAVSQSRETATSVHCLSRNGQTPLHGLQ